MKSRSGTLDRTRIRFRISAIAALALGVLSIGLSQLGDGTAGGEGSSPAVFYIPSEPAMRFVSVGHRSFLASMLWVRGMFYYADALMEREQATLLAPLLRAVVFLDSDWRYPYEFAGLVLEEKDGVPSAEGLEFLRTGVQRFPGEWRLRVYLAMGLRATQGDLSEIEAVLLPITQGEVSAPEYVRSMALTMAQEMSDSRRMVELISNLARTTEDPLVAVTIQGKIESILRKRLKDAPFDPAVASEALFALLRGEPSQVALAQGILLGVDADSLRMNRVVRMVADLSEQYHRYKLAGNATSN